MGPVGASDREADFSSTLESLQALTGDTSGAQHCADKTSLGSVAEGTPPGLGQTERCQSWKATTCFDPDLLAS